MPSASSDSLASPSLSDSSSRPWLSPLSSSSSSDSRLRSSPMSSESSRSCTASPKRRWSSTTFSSRSRSRPARSSIHGRHRSTSLRAAAGGALPGETLAHHQGERILDRRVGAVGDLVELAAMKAVVQHGREIVRDALPCGARRSPRRAPARPLRTRRAPAGRPAAARRWIAGSWQASREARSNRRGRARSRPPAASSLRGGSGSRALPPARPGRSAA